MSEPAARVGYDAYVAARDASDQKLEYVAGMIYAMSGGTPEHARLSMRMGRALGNALEGGPCEAYSSDLAVRIAGTDRTTYADVTVVCGEVEVAPEDSHAATNPILLVEVLSPSTEAADRGERWRHYQRLASLRAYVLVSQDHTEIEVFERDGDHWTFRTYGPDDTLRFAMWPDVAIPVESIYG